MLPALSQDVSVKGEIEVPLLHLVGIETVRAHSAAEFAVVSGFNVQVDGKTGDIVKLVHQQPVHPVKPITGIGADTLHFIKQRAENPDFVVAVENLGPLLHSSSHLFSSA